MPRRRGRQHTILPNFPKMCMKLRKKLDRRSATETISQSHFKKINAFFLFFLMNPGWEWMCSHTSSHREDDQPRTRLLLLNTLNNDHLWQKTSAHSDWPYPQQTELLVHLWSDSSQLCLSLIGQCSRRLSTATVLISRLWRGGPMSPLLSQHALK